MKQEHPLIIFSGGGTIGSVTPLLAIFTRLRARHPAMRFAWVGTKDGIERGFVRQYKLPYLAIPSGKLRRYFSLRNVSDFLKVLAGFFASLALLLRRRPSLLVSAGGYVSVPLHIAGWIMRVPSIILQQDLEIGLANKIMAPFAARIFVSLPEALNYFPRERSVVVGNPAREEFFEHTKEEGVKRLHLDPSLPVALIFGGGTGAAAINTLTEKALSQLVQFCQVVHLTGEGKSGNSRELAQHYERYHPHEFIRKQMAYALASADVVVSRAGFASLSEFSALGKPAIIIPIPDSHQEKNADFFLKRKAIRVLDERTITSDSFAAAIRELLFDEKQALQLGHNINAVFLDTTGERFISELQRVLEKKK